MIRAKALRYACLHEAFRRRQVTQSFRADEKPITSTRNGR